MTVRKRQNHFTELARTDPPLGGNTFAVARANVVLASTLPDLVYQKRDAPSLRLTAEPARLVDAVRPRPLSRPPTPAGPSLADKRMSAGNGPRAGSSEQKHVVEKTGPVADRAAQEKPSPSPSVRDRPDCRKRPSDNTPRKKGGSGSGPRRYIPWVC